MFRAALITGLTAFTMVLTFNTGVRAREQPRPGRYWLGWGTARLIVPTSCRPYQTFRGENIDLPGKYCRLGDNSGVTRQDNNGKVWAYTKSPV